jgi:hypothetical protein
LQQGSDPWRNRQRVGEDEEEVALAGDVVADPGPSGALARPRRHAAEFDLQDQFVPGNHLSTEPGTVQPAEERQLAGEPFIGEDRSGTDLGDRLAHQHTRQRRPSGEVTGEEELVTGQSPASRRGRAGHDRQHLVDEQERRSMRQQRLGAGKVSGHHRVQSGRRRACA